MPTDGDDGVGGGAASGPTMLYGRSCSRAPTSSSSPRQHSGRPSGKDGGDLGTLKRGELAQEIEARSCASRPGEVSTPFRSPARLPPLPARVARTRSTGDGARAGPQQIREILFRQKYDTRLEDWLVEIKQRAIIEVRM